MGASTDAYLVYGIQLEEGSFSSQGGWGPTEMKLPEMAETKIMAYCQEHGLKTQGPVGWLLCSYWG